MQTSTNLARWLAVAVIALGVNHAAFAQRTVTLRLNTATLPDTINGLDEIQIRGAIGGAAPGTLPGGNVIDWGSGTTLRALNQGGDYWEAVFQIPDDQELKFKFFTQAAEGEHHPGGWEDGGDHSIAAGTGDHDGGLHYFEKFGADRPYDWNLFADKPANTVGVHFRGYFCTANGKGSGYDPTDATQLYGVRGAPEPGVLDWGNTNVTLTRENNDKGTPGYDLYSGTAYYPAASAGQRQEYKFVVHDGGNVGWEEGNLSSNRSFVVPAEDTTLQWVYFGNTAVSSCGLPPQLATVIFSVDLAPLQDVGLFNKSRGDTLQVRGAFNGWGCNNPDQCLLLPFPGTSIYEAAVTLEAFPLTEYAYKFYIDFNNENFFADFGAQPPNGWEEPITTTGADRRFVFEGAAGQEQFLGDTRFNDVMEGNIMLGGESTDVTFNVDMNPAKTMADPFDPATHSVYVDLTGDGVWAFLAGIPRTSDGVGFRIDDSFTLADSDGDGIYSGTMTVAGPNYAALQYTYAYGTGGTFIHEFAGSTAQVGRRRVRYIQPNPDGSWPGTYSFPLENFHNVQGPLSERDACNPGADPNCFVNVSSEPSGEVPTEVTLRQNFPNPFNPTTSIEYTLDRTADVRLRVFDLLGREIATLVEAKQQPNTYRVSFDASRLASGTYMYRLETEGRTITRTMVLLK